MLRLSWVRVASALLGAGSLALVSCAAPTSTPQEVAAECRIEKTAEIPVELVTGHIVVPALINRSAARLVIDTGAERTALTPNAVARFGLSRSSTHQSTIIGIGGKTTSSDTYAAIELGGEELSRDVAVSELPIRGAAGEPVDGLIGADLLADYDVEISLPERRIRLYRVQNCTGNYVPWHGKWFSVPAMRTQRDRLLVPVQIGRRYVNAILDTGANSTLMPADVAERLGVTPAMLAHDMTGVSRGVDMNPVPLHRHLFERVRIGGEHFATVRVAVSEMRPSRGDLLLGNDWLLRRRVWLSYDTHHIFVQPVAMERRPGAPSEGALAPSEQDHRSTQ